MASAFLAGVKLFPKCVLEQLRALAPAVRVGPKQLAKIYEVHLDALSLAWRWLRVRPNWVPAGPILTQSPSGARLQTCYSVTAHL